MISLDTNILLYGINQDCPEFSRALEVVADLASSTDVVMSELVLIELYLLLRNPAVVTRPFAAGEAVEICQTYRRNPHWRLVEWAPIMDEVWHRASDAGFARHRIIDARLALTLRHHGVTEFITRNVRDFKDLGFERLRNPFSDTHTASPPK